MLPLQKFTPKFAANANEILDLSFWAGESKLKLQY